MSCAKMAEPIEIPFGLRTLVDPRNHALDGGSDYIKACTLVQSSFILVSICMLVLP